MRIERLKDYPKASKQEAQALFSCSNLIDWGRRRALASILYRFDLEYQPLRIISNEVLRSLFSCPISLVQSCLNHQSLLPGYVISTLLLFDLFWIVSSWWLFNFFLEWYLSELKMIWRLKCRRLDLYSVFPCHEHWPHLLIELSE